MTGWEGALRSRYAHRYFSEIGLGIDFTARDLQSEMKKKGLPWEIAKGFDYSAPVSEFFPVKQFKDIHNLSFQLGSEWQHCSGWEYISMIFSFEKIISYVSRFMTLKTGDLIFTRNTSRCGTGGHQ